jgi:hypothetical protein
MSHVDMGKKMFILTISQLFVHRLYTVTIHALITSNVPLPALHSIVSFSSFLLGMAGDVFTVAFQCFTNLSEVVINGIE